MRTRATFCALALALAALTYSNIKLRDGIAYMRDELASSRAMLADTSDALLRHQDNAARLGAKLRDARSPGCVVYPPAIRVRVVKSLAEIAGIPEAPAMRGTIRPE